MAQSPIYLYVPIYLPIYHPIITYWTANNWVWKYRSLWCGWVFFIFLFYLYMHLNAILYHHPSKKTPSLIGSTWSICSMARFAHAVKGRAANHYISQQTVPQSWVYATLLHNLHFKFRTLFFSTHREENHIVTFWHLVVLYLFNHYLKPRLFSGSAGNLWYRAVLQCFR